MIYCAMVEEGVVTGVGYFDELTDSMRARGFVECPKEVRHGWTFDGATFSPPVLSKYALIEDGVVTRTDQWYVLPDAMKALGYISCPDEVGPRWTYDGYTFNPPALPSLAEAQAAKIQDAYEIVKRRINGDLINLYSPGERDRWIHLQAQSDDVLDNGATETDVPELAFEAQQYGATLTDYAAIIRQRATDFTQFKSTLAARRLQHKDAIMALTDVQDVLDYDLSDLETIGTI